MYTLSVYIAGEIDLFENLDKVHITLLAASFVVSLNCLCQFDVLDAEVMATGVTSLIRNCPPP